MFSRSYGIKGNQLKCHSDKQETNLCRIYIILEKIVMENSTVHKTVFGIDFSSIKLEDFGKDENYTTGTDSQGNCYDEHTFNLEDDLFDQIALKVWEDDEGCPEYVWLTKNKCSYKELNVILEELTKAYGNKFNGPFMVNPFNEDNSLNQSYSFYRNWKFVKLNFETYSEPNLTITFQYDTNDREFPEE